MREVRAGLLAGLIALAALSAAVSADEDPVVVLWNESFSTTGPVWIQVECMKVSCPEMELVVLTDGIEQSHENPHLVEWSNWVDGNLSWRLIVESGTEQSDVQIEVILSRMDEWTEYEDLPNIVPPPGGQGNYPTIDTASPCQMHFCNVIDLVSEGVMYVGAFENESDKDSVMITGDPGDVILLNSLRGASDVSIEIWHRGTDSKSLVNTLERADMEYYFEYPVEGELWIRLIHSAEEGYLPYEFEIIRYDDETEAPNGGELSNPWNHGEAMPFYGDSSPLYYGHIAGSDSQGDSLLIVSGAKMHLFLQCSFTDDVEVEVSLHQMDGTTQAVESDCDGVFETTAHTVSVEFGLTTQGVTSAWAIMLSSLGPSDGNLIGDAPDFLWTESDDLSHWPLIEFNVSNGASMLEEEFVDVFAFEVTSSNGSSLRIDGINSQPVSYQILILDQNSWSIMNTSNGGLIDAPQGIHAIRVEKVGEASLTGYSFNLVNEGEIIETGPDLFVDQSNLFTNFYVFIGILLLTPLAVVIFWNRRVFWGGVSDVEVEKHEIRRLRRLKERIAEMVKPESNDEGVIESALHQLGDSHWKAVIEEWGNPIIRHNTENVDICVWKVRQGSATMLIGVKVADTSWDMAAMRIHSPEGSRVSIKQVSPKHMFQNEEIFLDKLKAKSRTFLLLTLEGEATNIGFQLSGLVNDEPLAAVPNRAIDWS
ncbi:MAG: hypothetical protein CND29_01345 [Marine Group II euryarchaeote MED-G36]|nr:MAG: hypothetical protein CND29_01345 [Marine Group II euryarchaeote MED-G36]